VTINRPRNRHFNLFFIFSSTRAQK